MTKITPPQWQFILIQAINHIDWNAYDWLHLTHDRDTGPITDQIVNEIMNQLHVVPNSDEQSAFEYGVSLGRTLESKIDHERALAAQNEAIRLKKEKEKNTEQEEEQTWTDLTSKE